MSIQKHIPEISFKKVCEIFSVPLRALRVLVVIILSFLFCQRSATAQTYSSIYGKIVNDSNRAPLIGVGITLYTPDSLKQVTVMTGNNGVFMFNNVPAGKYKLRATYIGFQTIITDVNAYKPTVNAGQFRMKWIPTTIGTAVIVGKVIPVEQKGDTTEFNADAYKTQPDATTEDLVNKMPGVSSQNGSVTVNGEQVAQVLVDGEPFFGNDPTIALKNLPAEVVDKIQVFDKLSDQAQFTGFDDGQSQKTINIVTRKNRRNGQFGKGYAGYGTDGRYLAGGNFNSFEGASRFSIIGLANNVNQQNFATEDILGALGGGGGQGRGGQGRGGSGGMGGGMGGNGGGGGSASGTGYSSGMNNFLVGQQGGITTTNSIGLNYTNMWDSNKVRLTASYFFNNAANTNNTQSSTIYTGTQNGNILNDTNKTNNTNYDQRLNGRFQWNMDSVNSLIITFKGTIQQTTASTSLGESSLLGDMVQSLSTTNNSSGNKGYDFTENVLFMHKFHKRGRTISLNLGSDVNNKNTPGSLYALNGNLRDTVFLNSVLNQQYTQVTQGTTLSSSVSYTEPVDSFSLFQFNYSPSVVYSNTDKATNNFDSITNTFTQFDTSLSNKYNSTYLTQSGGVSYRLSKGKKIFVMLSANLQYSTLSSREEFPEVIPELSRTYLAVIPRMVFNYRFTQNKNIRVIFQSSIAPPSVSQLQNVVNNSNPLLLNTGNPDLKQSHSELFTTRYGATNAKQGSTFLVYLNGTYITNYVGNTSFIPTKDTTFTGGIVVPKGSQLSMPENLQGYVSARSFITYGRAIFPLKINLNLNGGETYTRTPALINDVPNFSTNYTTSGGIVISSNISEKVDFTLSYTDNYSVVTNTLQNQADDNYLSQVYSGKINIIMFKGVVFNTSLTQTAYTGLTQAYNQSVLLWGGSLGYKFLKKQALLLSVSAFDILNRNKSISRTVTDTYIQDSQTQVLQRYFMFNIQYNIRNYKRPKAPGAPAPENSQPPGK
ncbi:MAG: outer membrane beta-barrel protein [Bacteroidia bacterium]